MIKLSLVKKFGIELVAGDGFSPKFSVNTEIFIVDAEPFNDSNVSDERMLTSFTPRLISDGIPASIDGDALLEITNGNGLVLYISARNVAWHAWKTWRPSMEWLVQQAADKPVTYKDDTQHFGEDVIKGRSEQLNESIKEADYISKGFMSRCVVMPFQEGYSVGYRAELTELAKPIFTQAMADAGELPPVGSECQIMLDGYWQNCFMVGLSKSGNPVIQMGVHCIESIGCDYKPLDTRTEKEKAVDAAFLAFNADKDTLGSIYDYWLNGDFKK